MTSEGQHGDRTKLREFLRPHRHSAVVALTECNGCPPGAALAAELGFANAETLMPQSGYGLAVLSPWPLRVLEALLEGFHHGLLHVAVAGAGGIEVMCYHGAPSGPAQRNHEAEQIAARVRLRGRRPGAPPLVLAGDLNMLSPADREHYGGLSTFSGRLRRKFFDGDARLPSYRAFELLLAAGLVDAAHPPGHRTAALQRTVPALHADAMHAAPMRLDYVLVAGAAAGMRCRVKRSFISDHHPLVCIFWWCRKPRHTGEL